MRSYVILLNWTDQGARNIRDTIKRARAFVDARSCRRAVVSTGFKTGRGGNSLRPGLLHG